MPDETNPQNDPSLPQPEDYGSDAIQHLSDIEHVRLRPAMYINDVGSQGLHHLVSELLDNSIDEVMANHATWINVTIHADGSASVEDDGRGIPVDRHEEESAKQGREVSALEVVMTNLKAGGKFNKDSYKTSGGLHGIGIKAMNFLSQWCEVQVYRNGFVWQQEYERGVAEGPVRKLGATKQRGTKITFKPDATIFNTVVFEYDRLQKRLRELAFLNSGVRIRFHDERNGEKEEFFFERGIVEFIEHLNRSSDPLHSDVIYASGELEGVQFEVALQYANEYTENVHSYVNNIHTPEGGTHVAGFRTALTRTLNSYGKKQDMFKDVIPTGEDFREGLTAIIAVRVPEPKFQSQVKSRLLNTEVEGIVNTSFGEFFAKYLEENPKTAKVLIRKGLLAAEAREAARKAKDQLRKRKNALGGGGLPGKLRDCISNEMERCELYLVEGDSAGGSAEGGRLRDFQAILPLRGKIINAYKSREDKVLANEEVQSMISAIGTGIGPDLDIAKRRYNKVIIMTDADVDGSHIRTLLLCFFYRQMFQLLAQGHIYIAQPPLFRVRQKKEAYYVQTEEAMRTQLLERGLQDATLELGNGEEITGERMEQLCRLLASVEDSLLTLERRGVGLREHALRIVGDKLPVYHVFVGNQEHWFTTREELDTFLAAQEEKTSAEAPASEGATPNGDGGEADAELAEVSSIHMVELHEVRTINSALAELKQKFNFGTEMLIPQDRTGSEHARFTIRRGDSEIGMEDLRGLPAAIRQVGQKGMIVTRFKGLGEMNAEELRETTLDPANRTLLQVSMRDAAAADDMFRVLMGDKVEPRREFIEKHALEVKNLDV